ncbi:MAG: glycine betaine ABC transporter substrate-binding protein [Arenicella sp.]
MTFIHNLKPIVYPLGIALCLSTLMSLTAQAVTTIKVGSEGFTEQIILSEMTTQYLEEKGFKVDNDRGLTARDLREKLERNEINLFWDYVATAFLATHNQNYTGQPLETIYSWLKTEDEKIGLVWLDKSNANDTYALAMRSEDAKAKGIRTISDLARYQNNIGGLTLASDLEWYTRNDGLGALEKKYKFNIPREDVQRTEIGLVYKALRDEKFDVALVYSTDGRIISMGLTVLEDDRRFFPQYILAPVIHKDALQANPQLAGYLNDISALLTDESMTKLNARVDVDRVLIWEVAEDFLIEHGLLN